jgi:hypothetical protein
MLIEKIHRYLSRESPEPEKVNVTNKRAEMRKSVLLRATIYPIDFLCGVRISDVSATGLKGGAEFQLLVGQTLHVTVDNLTYHAGVVRWTRDWEFGLSLANARKIFGGQSADIDHGEQEGHHPRASRAKINIEAHFATGRPPRPALVRNLSDSGMLLDTSPGLKAGQDLIVMIGNALPIYGRVQWSNNERVGFKAKNPISINISRRLD